MTKCPVYYARANNCKKLVFTMLLFLFTNSLRICYLHQSKEHKNFYQNMQIKSGIFVIIMNLITCIQMFGLFCPLLYCS